MMSKCVNLLVFVSRSDYEAQAGFQGIGEATTEGRQVACTRDVQVGSSAAVGRDPADGSRLGAAYGRRRPRWTQARRTGTATPTRCRAGARIGQGAHGGGVGRRVFDGAMDVAPHRQIDLQTLRRRIQHRPSVAPAASDGLLLPEAGETSHPAQRGRDCPLETAYLARAQKKAQRESRTIVFIDESGLSERPSVARTWSLRGH